MLCVHYVYVSVLMQRIWPRVHASLWVAQKKNRLKNVGIERVSGEVVNRRCQCLFLIVLLVFHAILFSKSLEDVVSMQRSELEVFQLRNAGTLRLFDDAVGYDTTLTVGGAEIRCHAFVLSSLSDVFTTMLFGPYIESQPGHKVSIGMERATADLVSKLVRIMYGGSSDDVTDDEVPTALEFADMYQVRLLQAVMERRVVRQSVTWCRVHLECVRQFCTASTVQHCEKLLLSNGLAERLPLSAVCNTTLFLESSPSAVSAYLADGELICNYEIDVFDAAIAWYQYNEPERRSQVCDVLLSCLRTEQIHLETLQESLDTLNIHPTHPLVDFVHSLPRKIAGTLFEARPCTTSKERIVCLIKYYNTVYETDFGLDRKGGIKWCARVQDKREANDFRLAAGLEFVLDKEARSWKHCRPVSRGGDLRIRGDCLLSKNIDDNRELIAVDVEPNSLNVRAVCITPGEKFFKTVRSGAIETPYGSGYADEHILVAYDRWLFALHPARQLHPRLQH